MGKKFKLITLLFFIFIFNLCVVYGFDGCENCYQGMHDQCVGISLWKNDASNHWKVCDCQEGKTVLKSAHSFSWSSSGYGGTHTRKCSTCGYVSVDAESHSYTKVKGTGDNCWRYFCNTCSVSYSSWYSHSGGTDTCTEGAVCSYCGETYGSALGHSAGAAATCTSAQTCTRCGTTLANALGHIDSSWQMNESQHWKYCTRSCCSTSTITSAKTNHADTDSDGYCDTCGYQMTVAGNITLSENSGTVTYGTASKTFTVSSHHGGTLSVEETSSTAANVSLSGTTITISNLASLNAGTTITVKVTSGETPKYFAASATYTLTINKASISPTVSMTGYTYSGTKSTPTVSGNTGNGTVTYYYSTTNSNSGGTNWSNVTSSTTLNAGTYYMYATIATTTNYNAATTSAVQFVISKAPITPTISMSGYTYAGTKSNPSVSGNLGGGTVTYYYNTSNSNSGGTAWAGVTSTTLDVGTYYIYAEIAESTNYNAVKTAAKSFTISKANVSATVNMSGYTYAGTKSTPSVTSNPGGGTVTYYYNTSNSNSGGTNWNTVTSSTSLNAGTYYMYATIDATTNYNGTTTGTTAFTIAKGSISPTVSMTGYTYGNTKNDPTISGNTENGAVTYYYNTNNSNSGGTNWNTVTSSTSLNAGTYYMYAIVAETTNYNGNTSPTVSFTVDKRPITLTWGTTEFLYNTLSHLPSATWASGVTGETLNISIATPKIDVGTYTATATLDSVTGGKANVNNYTLTNPTTSFTISPDPSIVFNVTLDKYLFVWNGSEHKPIPTVKAVVNGNELTLIENTDYTVSYKNNIEPGTIPTVVITGIKNYGASSAEVNFTIDKAIRGANVLMDDFYYATQLPTPGLDFTEEPGITVYYYNTVNENSNGTAWSTVDDAYHLNVGTYYMYATIEETTHYKAETTPTTDFIIMKSKARHPKVENKVYNGKVQVGVYDEFGIILSGITEASDVGTYTAYGELNSNFEWSTGDGPKEYTWTMSPCDINMTTLVMDPFLFTYTGAECKPDIKMTLNDFTLVEGRDYTLAFEDNVEVGQAKVVMTGINNFTGVRTEVFEIEERSIEKIELDSYEYDYTGAEIKPSEKVYDAEGNLLVRDRDYTVYYTNNIAVGTAIVGATGIGNYKGNVEISFEIVADPIEKATVTLKGLPFIYDGNEKCPEAEVVLSGKTLVRGRDYEISYENNINAGENTAVAIITGRGKYMGTINKNFTIMKANRKATITPGKGIIVGTTEEIPYSYEGEETEATLTIDDLTIVSPVEKTYTSEGTIELTGLREGKTLLKLTVAGNNNYHELVLNSEVTVFAREDSTYPVYGTVIINDGDEYTVTPRTKLTLSVDFGKYMYISETNETPDVDSIEWNEFSEEMPYVFNNTEGEKTIYVWYKDDKGNISDVATDSIILDYDLTIPAHDNVLLDQTNINVTGPDIEYYKYYNTTIDVNVIFKQEDVLVNGIRSGVDNTTKKYGYKLESSSGDYIWQDSPIIKGIEYNQLYAFATQAYDRAGNGLVISEATLIQTERKYATTITLEDTNAQYNGKTQNIAEAEFTIIDDIQITGDVIYTYYVDEACTIPTSPERDGSINNGGAPSVPGVYYVQAQLVNDQVYYDTTSNVAELRIGWDISKTTTDDVFAYVERIDPNGDEFILKVIGDGNMADLSELLPNNSDESLIYWADYKDKITELEIVNEGNDSITNIGSEIFNNLTEITEINIPDTIEKIGDYAFEGCTGVTEKIIIPISVEEIGSGAFSNVNTPEFEVAYGNSNYDTIDGVLTDDEHKELIAYPNGKTDEKYTIPDTITTIMESAFAGSDNLKDVVIPDGVEIIANRAFNDCPNLEVIEIEDLMGDTDNIVDLRVIGNNAFDNIGDNSIIYTFSEDIAKKFTDGKTHNGDKTDVYWPPVITVHPIDMNGDTGANIKFIVDAKAGYPVETKYQWFKTKDNVDTEISGATGKEYITPSLTSNNNNDYYYCRVYNAQYYFDRGFVNSEKGKLTIIANANYIVERGTYNSYLFEYLNDAFEFAITDDIIKPLKTVDNESNATLTGDKSVTFDLNGNTINLVGTITIDAGSTLEMLGTGNINKSGDYVIENKGKLVLNGEFAINNSTGHGIKTIENSTLEVTGGNINVDSDAIYAEDATVTIDGANVNIAASTSSLRANAVSLNKKTIFNMSAGNISIKYTSEMTNGNIYGLYINGTVDAYSKITGGTISATSTSSPADAIANGGLSDITIAGTANAKGSRSGIITTSSNSYGDIILQGGTISGGEFGILNNATAAKVTLGKQGGGVAIDTPVVVGEKVAIFNTKENNTLEFYDGILYSHGTNVVYEELNNTDLGISSANVESIYTEDGRSEIKTESKYSIAVEENVSYNSSTYKAAYLKQDKEPTLSGIEDQTVPEGEKATFEIIATGGQPDEYEYEWEVSTDGGITWSKVTTGTGMNTNKYITPITTFMMDGYRYRCIVSNGRTKVTSPAVTLNVISKDDFGNQRPIVRIVFTDGRVITQDIDGDDVVNMQIIVKSFAELKSLKVNGAEIFEETVYENANGTLKIEKDINSPIEIKKEIYGEEKVVEYTYTYNMKVYANDIITVDVIDAQGKDNTATQTVDVFFELIVKSYLSELSKTNDKLVITFYANKPVKPIKSISNSYINSTYLDLVSLESSEYSYRYILELEDPLPTTEFWFEDEYKNQASEEIKAIPRVKYKDIKFNDGTLQIEDLTVVDAYNVAQDLENVAEVNSNEEIQARYGLNSVQSDMFMSRARDLGAIDILNGTTTAKSYDGVFTSNIEATVQTQDSAYSSIDAHGNLFVAAVGKNAAELSDENRRYVDVISKDVSLYKGMDISNFTIDSSDPYMYATQTGVSNIAATTIAEAGFRATIIAK